MKIEDMKIAFVKQDCYQDLYVASNDASVEEILFSSQGRVGPIGLFTLLNTDFYIVKEEKKHRECRFWERTAITRKAIKNDRALKNCTLDCIPGQEFKKPGSNKPNGFYAVDLKTIDWGKYNIVICVNCAIPTYMTRKYPGTLWAYMIGAANFAMDKVYFGYDVSLNQEICGRYNKTTGVLDFPYTFVGDKCLEKIVASYLKRPPLNEGIYGEINTTTERPVIRIPQFEPISDATGQPIKVHKQLIRDNLCEMYDAKYYLKVGGRITRGNGAIEAISCGTVVLMNPEDIICGQILPKDAWVMNAEDAIEKIMFLDSHPEEYSKLLEEERMLLRNFVVDYPLHNLERLYNEKNGKVNSIKRYSDIHYLKDMITKIYNWSRKRTQFSK
ncbi:MAG: hypothetical protein LUG99_09365 [Lachnospiraceae bacterium]|nr:hypothetical protein [Lachnospiraceae bacterium]